MLDSVYDMMLERHDPSRMTVMGDSMGGNLALSFPQTLIGRKPMCESIVLLSPWLDMTGEHPDTERYYEREPRLSLYELKRCAEQPGYAKSKLGKEQANAFLRRLNVLKASECFEDLRFP